MDMFDALDDFLGQRGECPSFNLSSNDDAVELVSEIETKAIENHSPLKTKKAKPSKGEITKMKRLGKIKEIVNDKPVPEKKRKQNSKPSSKKASRKNLSDEQTQQQHPDVICFDPDDESPQIPVSINTNLRAETSLDSTENEEVKVKIKFETELMEIRLRPFQKLSDILLSISELKGTLIDSKHFALLFKSKIISTNETLHSIDYIPGFIITVVRNSIGNEIVVHKTDMTDPNKIELKIQSAFRKKSFMKSINKTDNLNVLVFQCAEELGVDPKKIRLVFDGDTINLNTNAAENDLEGGEIIDCFVVQ